MESGQFVRGYIEPVEGRYKGAAGRVEFCFNPGEYTVSKQNIWNQAETKGLNSPPLEFGGGVPRHLAMSLLFDTYEKREDVRTFTDKLMRLMEIDPSLTEKNSKSRPPICELRWGKMWSFACVLESLDMRFTLFLPDGTPARAEVSLSLTQARDETKLARQNPTSGGEPGHRVWRVSKGETIDWISFQVYRDATVWRRIADFNHLDDPLKLVAGQVLQIPPL
ncbi:MAG: LysM peptidoglycan-binding domain-containing protein [Desulfamplus sp.]